MELYIPVNTGDIIYEVIPKTFAGKIFDIFSFKWIATHMNIKINGDQKYGKVYAVEVYHPDGSGSHNCFDFKDFNETWFTDPELARAKELELYSKMKNTKESKWGWN